MAADGGDSASLLIGDASEVEFRSSEVPLDLPLLAAEISAALLGIVGFLLLFSGVGFFSVKPPGEQDLCRVDTLGLQNLTQTRQQMDLTACHALYAGAFNVLGAISVPFILCGAVAVLSAAYLFSALRSPDPVMIRRSFCYTGILDILGGVTVWIPSIYFPGLAAVVAAGLAPIHAYFIGIMLGHFAIRASHADDSGSRVRDAAYLYEVLYQGYCAASRVELCLTVGSVCMILLFWLCLLDLCRNVVSTTCWRPRCEPLGSQRLQCQQLLARYRKT
eukprot:TRINITY_DN79446_c0_g1_i1.p1 TRINITY_DN79446_c0_g1~~TRINITY_DN79446_c0_g1_i1.p1  ORF type:complete len:276 (-),score=52.04 TRINITY_DN79446_c0_g1_i1:97-924(-)